MEKYPLNINKIGLQSKDPSAYFMHDGFFLCSESNKKYMSLIG